MAATIRACRCGAVRIAGHPRPRRPGVGSVIDPARRAPPVRTSEARWRPSSATAGSIVSGGRSAAMRSGRAGRRRPSPSRSPRQAPSATCRRSSTRSMMKPLFGSSNSWRSARRRPRLPGGRRRGPQQTSSLTRSRQPSHRRHRLPPANRAGAYGATPRSDPAQGADAAAVAAAPVTAPPVASRA